MDINSPHYKEKIYSINSNNIYSDSSFQIIFSKDISYINNKWSQ